MKLTFKYPVYPTKTQEHTLFEWLDHLCELQNSARHDRIVARETENRFVTQYDQQALLTVARKKYDDFRGSAARYASVCSQTNREGVCCVPQTL